MEVNYETEKNVIESLILTLKKPVSILEINKEYEKCVGYSIPYLQLGFTSLETFIASLGENVSMRYSCNGTLLLSGKTINEAEHIKTIIDGQNDKSRINSAYKQNFSGAYYKQNKFSGGNSSIGNAFNETQFINKFGRKPLHFQVQQRIKAILKFHPGGISAENLLHQYNEEYFYYKGDLNFHSHGYDSLEELLSSCSSDVLTFEGPLRNRMFYPKIRLDNSQLAETIKLSLPQFNRASDNLFEEVEKNRVMDELYVTFQMDFFKNVLTFPIEVGEVYSPLKFYVLIKSFSAKLDELTLEMENYYMNNGNISRWTIKTADILFELPVAVYSEEEKTLYRGIITNISEVDKVQVYLVDYGTNVQINCSHLLYLHKRFFDLPAQAINAKLQNLKLINNLKNGLSKASQKFLHLVTNFKSLTAKVYDVDIKNYSLHLEIFGDDGISINDILVNEGYCLYWPSLSCHNNVAVEEQISQDALANCYYDKFQHYTEESPQQPNDNRSSLKEHNKVAVEEQISQDANCNYDQFQHYTEESPQHPDDKRSSLKENETIDQQLNQDNMNFEYDKFPDYIQESTSSIKEAESCLGKLTPLDDESLKVCGLTNSFRTSATTTDTGFLSSSDEDNALKATGTNSLHNNLLPKALMSLESARTFIKHERRQILSQLSEDSSLNRIYVSLSTMKAHIVALETELKGIIRNS